VAHRGGDGEFPGNTLEAFYNAYSVDERVIMETDINITKDGVLILNHETSLDKRTNVKGNISDWNYTDLIAERVNFGYHNKAESDELTLFMDEYGKQMESKIRYFSYAEPFFAGYAVVRIGENCRHIDMAGNLRFKMDNEKVIYRSAVYWKGGDEDRCECVIVTDNGIHLCQEDGETAVIKETLYRGSTIAIYDEPHSITDSTDGVLLFNYNGQAMLYEYPDPSDSQKRLVKRFIPILE
jgi:hypothetical protein